MRIQFQIVLALCIATVSPYAPAAGKGDEGSTSRITKCKDENGKWHYGDYAASACQSSRVTTLNQQGIKIDEVDAAMTRDEMRALREARQRASAAKAAVDARRSRDRRLLMTYESIDRLEAARDERLGSVDRFIRADEEFLMRLQDQHVALEARAETNTNKKLEREIGTTKEQITDYEDSLAKRQEERRKIEEQFNDDIQRYKELLEQQPDPTSLGLN